MKIKYLCLLYTGEKTGVHLYGLTERELILT